MSSNTNPQTVSPQTPPNRGVDFASRTRTGLVVKNQDQTRKYVLVAKNQMTLYEYETNGWVREIARAGGPYLFEPHGTAKGVPATGLIEAFGHVLMSIDKAVLAEMELHGDELGGLGSAHYDALEKKIITQGGVDLMRGQVGRGMVLTTGTTGLQREG